MRCYVMPPFGTGSAALWAALRRYESLGVDGVLFTDHLFVTAGDGPERRVAHGDPFVLAATVAARSERLEVGTIVANTSLEHPALVLRHFVELAALHGGRRVLAGIGAGWNVEEFEALGMTMARHGLRARRLSDVARLARQLFDEGRATLVGEGFSTYDLPAAAMPGGPPRLLLGGGSDFLLEVAGRYADQLDLNGASNRLPLGRDEPRRLDGLRRATTTVEDLVASSAKVAAAARDAGRPPGSVELSVLVGWVEPCSAAEVGSREEAIARLVGAPPLPLAECPYALVGPPERMRALLAERVERIGLSAIVVPDGPHLETLCGEVLPGLV